MSEVDQLWESHPELATYVDASRVREYRDRMELLWEQGLPLVATLRTEWLAHSSMPRVLAQHGDAELVAIATNVMVKLARSGPTNDTDARIARHVLELIGTRSFSWAVEDCEIVCALATLDLGGGSHIEAERLGVRAAALLSPQQRMALFASLQVIYARLRAGEYWQGEVRVGAVESLRRMLPGFEPDVLPFEVPHTQDSWGPLVRQRLGERPGHEVVQLIWHLAACTSTRPSKTWIARVVELSRPLPAQQCLRTLLESVLDATPADGGPYRHDLLGGWNADLARGAAWALGLVEEDWATLLLRDVALFAGLGEKSSTTPRSLIIAGACIAGLAQRADSAPELLVLQARLKHKTLLKPLRTAVSAAARRGGMTQAELEERRVSTHGFDATGRRETAIGRYVAVLRISEPDTISLTFLADDGSATRATPADVKIHHLDALAAIKKSASEAKNTLRDERTRLENLLVDERTWAFEDWDPLYRRHPLTGAITERLLWQVRLGDTTEWRSVWPTDDNHLDIDGNTVPVGPTSLVRLWHPLKVDAEEVRGWRDVLDDKQIRQPFKQVFREIYLLTPAEITTGDYSNRFAGHILNYRQFYALARSRSWTAEHLGHWDGGHAGLATKEVVGGVWRVEFNYRLFAYDENQAGDASLMSTDQVTFSGHASGEWQPVDFVLVPHLVFSEAMRDVDLFIGVASIASDPAWADRGGRAAQYWREQAVSPLTPNGTSRHEALARLLPRTNIAERCTLGDRYLLVQGNMHTYKIHLGSGNVLMSPDDAYLCIVPAHYPTTVPPLPFEYDGDGRLALILSKAFMLANDHAIADPSIVAQIAHRPRPPD